MALRDEELVRFMGDHAAAAKKDLPAVQKEARKYLDEIAADYSDFYIELWDKALTWLWNNVYDGVVVDREGLVRVRDISRRMPCVIIPCHRSHIDYLLLSYVFYKHNIPLPFVAAGTNLMFWPLGYVFRKAGAFFIRRTFGGNFLYRQVMETYIKTLLGLGYPLEFFIEGGRSRTGKMVMPKYGMLSMVIQANMDRHRDLAIIPVFIGYDRVMEEKAYLQELGGAAKEKERATSVIKSRKLLDKRYGRVYVNVGEPIYMRTLPAGPGETAGVHGHGRAPQPLPEDQLRGGQRDQPRVRRDAVRARGGGTALPLQAGPDPQRSAGDHPRAVPLPGARAACPSRPPLPTPSGPSRTPSISSSPWGSSPRWAPRRARRTSSPRSYFRWTRRNGFTWSTTRTTSCTSSSRFPSWRLPSSRRART